MDHSAQVVLVVLGMIFIPGVIIAIGTTWLSSRTKIKAIEVLKAYAEKGEEPPASVLEAVNQIGKVAPPPPPPPPTRASHLSVFAGAVVVVIGAAGFAWWRLAYGDPGSPLAGLAIIVAIVFAAGAAYHLVAANAGKDGGR